MKFYVHALLSGHTEQRKAARSSVCNLNTVWMNQTVDAHFKYIVPETYYYYAVTAFPSKTEIKMF